MKYENPICEIVELNIDVITGSAGYEEPDTPIMPTA